MNIQAIGSYPQINKMQNIPFQGRQVHFQGVQSDMVSFTSKNSVTPEEKLTNYAQKYLKDIDLKPDQQLKVTVSKDQIPFANILSREAYKMSSGNVIVDVKEPKFEALRKKYGAPEFKYKAEREQYLKDQNAAFVDFTTPDSPQPYKEAKLTAEETQKLVSTIKSEVPESVQKNLELDPKEVIDNILNVQKDQPVFIAGEREHEDNIYKLVEYIYKNKGPVPVDVSFNERSPNNFGRTKLEYADEKVLEDVPPALMARMNEILNTKSARLFLEGEDPDELSGVDPDRIVKQSVAVGKAVKPIRDRLTVECPWNIYYAPTTKSAAAAYPEYKDEISALTQAAKDAKKINRVGEFGEHTQKLQHVANKMNEFRKQGMDTIHFVSRDPKTGKPDGKTDLYIGLSELAKFQAATEKTPDGQEFVANTPTEEVFSTPDKTKTNGWVSATMPLCLNGNMIEGIRIKFKGGKAVEVHADKNEKLLQEHIKKHKDADMLGEVALVAGSPIFDLGRVFKSTLLDENAACHIALGSGYSSCIEGADEIKDPKKKKEFLKKHNVNEDSTTHNDFMIGGPNVMVEGIKHGKDGKETGRVTLIENNKFQV